MRKKLLLIFAGLFLISLVYAQSDISVFQGQYYNETSFIQGTFPFVFDIYDAGVGGNLVGSYKKNLTTGNWGQWRIEVPGVSAASNDTTKDYFIEISIDGVAQLPRRRLSHFNYLRKDVDETSLGVLDIKNNVYVYDLYVNNTKVCLADGTNCQVQNISFSENDTLQTITDMGAVTNNSITIGSVLNFILGGFIQEFVDRFLISKSLEISGNLNVTGDIRSNDKLICLEDGTNCLVGGGGNNESSIKYVSFISTVDGKLNKNDRYLALGTDGGISGSVTEMAWIIDRDMTITGILWDSKSNSRTKTSAITLMGGGNKNSLSDTSLSKDIQGVVSGSDLTFSVSLSQGDAVAIKYDSGGKGGDIEDLSITLIGRYS